MNQIKRRSKFTFGRDIAIGILSIYALLVVVIIPSEMQDARDTTLNLFKTRLHDRAASLEALIKSELAERKGDVRFLASTPPISGIVRAFENDGFDLREQSTIKLWRRRLETIFAGYLAAHPHSRQVRYIGIADGGREIVRAERFTDGIQTVALERLPTKSHRGYFQDIAKLNAMQVYVAPISLNREFGELQRPHWPALRVATPVLTADGTAFGMVVINRDASALLAALRSDIGDDIQTYLTNNAGDYVMHPITQHQFGFDLGTPSTWHDEFSPTQGKSSDAVKIFNGPNGPVHALIRDIQYSSHSPDAIWRLIVTAPDKLITEEVVAARNRVMTWLVTATAVLGAFLLLLMLAARRRQEAIDKQAELAAIVSNSRDAIISLDLDGVVTSWNQGAADMLGYSIEEAVGQSILELIQPHREAATETRSLERVAQGESIAAFDTVRRHRDGHLIDVSLSMSPVKSQDGEITGASEVIRDIRLRKKAQRQAEELNATLERRVDERTAEVANLGNRLRLATEAAGIGVWDLDLQTNELVWDHTMRELYGASESTPITYEYWRSCVVAEDRPETEKKLQSAIQREARFYAKFRIRNANGQLRYLNGLATGIYNEDGEATRVVGVNLDVTQAHLAESAMAHAKEAADESNRAKSQFVANMSHELRTPMHAIIGFANVGRSNAADLSASDHEEIYTDISISANRLLSLISDLLDLSKLEAGHVAFERKQIDLNEVAQAVIQELKPLLDEKAISCDVTNTGRCCAYADAAKIHQVFLNVISNSIRFSPEGSHIQIDLESHNRIVRSRIRDQGPGIPSGELEQVFEKFHQGSHTRTGAGGTGLGLSICREIIQAHGGRIWASSNGNGGATIIFELPAGEGDKVN